MDKTQAVKYESVVKINESLRNFLLESKIYEALPQNSEVIILDKTFSCYDTFEIIFSNDCEDVVTWNSEISNFDGLITYSDICEILLFLFKNVMTKKSNIQIFKEKKKMRDVILDNNDETIEEEQFEIEDEDVGSFLKPRTHSFQETSDKNLFHLLDKISEIDLLSFNEETKLKLILDLRAITLKNWTHKFYSELFQNYNLISMDIDKNLYEVCEKIINEKLHRLIIMDKESQVVVGTITQRDILLFIVRNFKSDSAYEDGFETPISQLGWGPNSNIVTMKETASVFNSFAVMIEQKLSAIPIVDQNENFMGFIQKNDIILIIKDDRYEMLTKTNAEFLNFMKQIKSLYKTSYEGNKFFSPNDSLKIIVEKILFSSGNRLIYINETNNKICGIITLTDLFNFYLKSL